MEAKKDFKLQSRFSSSSHRHGRSAPFLPSSTRHSRSTVDASRASRRDTNHYAYYIPNTIDHHNIVVHYLTLHFSLLFSFGIGLSSASPFRSSGDELRSLKVIVSLRELVKKSSTRDLIFCKDVGSPTIHRRHNR
jgi:hypothetical protein